MDTKIYDMLYARTSTGAIQTWQIIVEGNKFKTIIGQLDGKKIESNWTECIEKNTGKKNATTGHEQACKEAESKIKNKLRKEGYFKNVELIDDSLTYIEPMLAHVLKDNTEKVSYPCMVDRKYNGGRAVATKGGIHTRRGERYLSIPHIYNTLLPIFEKYPNLVLDGEGYNHEHRYKLNELMKILRTVKTTKLTNDFLEKSKNTVRYYVYDGYGWDNITETTACEERRKALSRLLKDVPYIVVVPYGIAKTVAEVNTLYATFVDDGYEGAMIRNINSPYEHKRSYNLLKVKPEMDDECEIVDVMLGTGNWSGVAKTVTVKWKDKTFDATLKGSQLQCLDVWNNKNTWIGKTVTFLYNDLTGLGIPNFARIDLDNCFKS